MIHNYDEVNTLLLTNKYFSILQLALILHPSEQEQTIMIHRDEFQYGMFLKILANIKQLFILSNLQYSVELNELSFVMTKCDITN